LRPASVFPNTKSKKQKPAAKADLTMKDLLVFLQGKKTHATCVVVIALLIGQWAKWWTIPAEVYGALVVLALAFLRAGVSNEIGSLQDEPLPGGQTKPATSTGTAPMREGRPGGTGAITSLMGVIGIMGLMGCASPSAFFNAEKCAVDGATGSMHLYNQWYRGATNAAAADQAKCEALTREAETVWGAGTNFYRTITLVDALRVTYETNSANTNLTALQAALGALSLQATNITATVKLLISK
jgi:hypothetical protein